MVQVNVGSARFARVCQVWKITPEKFVAAVAKKFGASAVLGVASTGALTMLDPASGAWTIALSREELLALLKAPGASAVAKVVALPEPPEEVECYADFAAPEVPVPTLPEVREDVQLVRREVEKAKQGKVSSHAASMFKSSTSKGKR